MTTANLGTLPLPLQVRDLKALDEIFSDLELDACMQLEAWMPDSEEILEPWQETGWTPFANYQETGFKTPSF